MPEEPKKLILVVDGRASDDPSSFRMNLELEGVNWVNPGSNWTGGAD